MFTRTTGRRYVLPTPHQLFAARLRDSLRNLGHAALVACVLGLPFVIR